MVPTLGSIFWFAQKGQPSALALAQRFDCKAIQVPFRLKTSLVRVKHYQHFAYLIVIIYMYQHFAYCFVIIYMYTVYCCIYLHVVIYIEFLHSGTDVHPMWYICHKSRHCMWHLEVVYGTRAAAPNHTQKSCRHLTFFDFDKTQNRCFKSMWLCQTVIMNFLQCHNHPQLVIWRFPPSKLLENIFWDSSLPNRVHWSILRNHWWEQGLRMETTFLL